jgi:hypothetical protein
MEVEQPNFLLRRVDEAAKHLPVDHLAMRLQQRYRACAIA